MGSGKTAVLSEASDILDRRQVVHAAIDLDALGLAHLPSSGPTDVIIYENFRSVCGNFAAAGIRRFLVARAVEGAHQLGLCREIVQPNNLAVCRLVASLETMKRRVQARDSGISQSQCVARVAELNSILDAARLEDFTVTNEDRSLTGVALEMLVKAGWISG